MSYWDTSAIIPLLVDEPMTPTVLEVAQQETEIIVWWGTVVECYSAISRRERESGAELAEPRRLLADLRQTWSEVLATDAVREHSRRLLLRHPLRASDALQLGAALVWASSSPVDHRFACLDERLSRAARGEGFQLIDWT